MVVKDNGAIKYFSWIISIPSSILENLLGLLKLNKLNHSWNSQIGKGTCSNYIFKEVT